MRFTDIDLSRKLVALGCVSESNYEYFKRSLVGETPSYCTHPDRKSWRHLEPVPAFTIADFVETNDVARGNCKKVWGDEALIFICPACEEDLDSDPFEWAYHKLIKMINSDDWLAYLTEAVEEAMRGKEAK